MKKTPLFISAYPVFIMHEQLNLNGFLENTYSHGLDAVWEHCCMEYEIFINSEYNDENKSEYDCIVKYVQHLNKPTLN